MFYTATALQHAATMIVYDVEHSRRVVHFVPCTLSTVATLAAIHPPAMVKGKHAATASPESNAVMSAVKLNAGHVEEAVAPTDLADRLVKHVIVSSPYRVLRDRSSNNCWHGAGAPTIATEVLRRMVGAPFEVSIRCLHTMVCAYKSPWSYPSGWTLFCLAEFCGWGIRALGLREKPRTRSGYPCHIVACFASSSIVFRETCRLNPSISKTEDGTNPPVKRLTWTVDYKRRCIYDSGGISESKPFSLIS